MRLDIRLPIGFMFLVLGPILLITGLIRSEPLATRTGLAMSVFGALMLGGALAARRRARA